MAIPKPSSVFPGGSFMIDFEVYFGSLPCWNTEPLFNFNVWTDLWTLASNFLNILWNPLFLPLAEYCLCSQLPHNPKAQWIHHLPSQLARCSSLQRLHPFFSKHSFFGGGQKSWILVLLVQSTLFQKASTFSLCHVVSSRPCLDFNWFL